MLQVDEEIDALETPPPVPDPHIPSVGNPYINPLPPSQEVAAPPNSFPRAIELPTHKAYSQNPGALDSRVRKRRKEEEAAEQARRKREEELAKEAPPLDGQSPGRRITE